MVKLFQKGNNDDEQDSKIKLKLFGKKSKEEEAVEEEPEEPVSLVRKILNIIKNVIVIAVAIFALCMLIFTIVSVTTFNQTDRTIFGYNVFVVTSNSMHTEDDQYFDAGDLILVKEVDPETLKEGDVISFTSQNTESFGETITHAILSLTVDEDGNPGFITYGAATGTPDEAIVTYNYVIGKYQSHIPKLGYFFNFLKTPAGYVCLILIPFLLLIGYEAIRCVKLFRAYKRQEQDELEAQRQEILDEQKKTQEAMQQLLGLREAVASGDPNAMSNQDVMAMLSQIMGGVPGAAGVPAAQPQAMPAMAGMQQPQAMVGVMGAMPQQQTMPGMMSNAMPGAMGAMQQPQAMAGAMGAMPQQQTMPGMMPNALGASAQQQAQAMPSMPAMQAQPMAGTIPGVSTAANAIQQPQAASPFAAQSAAYPGAAAMQAMPQQQQTAGMPAGLPAASPYGAQAASGANPMANPMGAQSAQAQKPASIPSVPGMPFGAQRMPQAQIPGSSTPAGLPGTVSPTAMPNGAVQGQTNIPGRAPQTAQNQFGQGVPSIPGMGQVAQGMPNAAMSQATGMPGSAMNMQAQVPGQTPAIPNMAGMPMAQRSATSPAFNGAQGMQQIPAAQNPAAQNASAGFPMPNMMGNQAQNAGATPAATSTAAPTANQFTAPNYGVNPFAVPGVQNAQTMGNQAQMPGMPGVNGQMTSAQPGQTGFNR